MGARLNGNTAHWECYAWLVEVESVIIITQVKAMQVQYRLNIPIRNICSKKLSGAHGGLCGEHEDALQGMAHGGVSHMWHRYRGLGTQ